MVSMSFIGQPDKHGLGGNDRANLAPSHFSIQIRSIEQPHQINAQLFIDMGFSGRQM